MKYRYGTVGSVVAPGRAARHGAEQAEVAHEWLEPRPIPGRGDHHFRRHDPVALEQHPPPGEPLHPRDDPESARPQPAHEAGVEDRRTDSHSCRAPPSARSMATSQPEFPAPTTSTGRPLKGCAFLYSLECKRRPSNRPGHAGITGSRRLESDRTVCRRRLS